MRGMNSRSAAVKGSKVSETPPASSSGVQKSTEQGAAATHGQGSVDSKVRIPPLEICYPG